MYLGAHYLVTRAGERLMSALTETDTNTLTDPGTGLYFTPGSFMILALTGDS